MQKPSFPERLRAGDGGTPVTIGDRDVPPRVAADRQDPRSVPEEVFSASSAISSEVTSRL